ncbi:MAG: flagellar basal body rod C-terminal domain-containing protein [Acidimicrobiales bacterium]
MSFMWSAIDTAGSAADVDQTWIDAIGGNVANMEDGVTPGKPVYQAQYVEAGEQANGEGVQVNTIDLGPKQGEIEYEPENPVANAQGEVEYPVVDLGSQLVDLEEAQASYQANAQVLSDAKTAYQSILDIKA